MLKENHILGNEKGQGATEYLLMLAIALILVSTVINYIMDVRGTGGETIEDQLDNIRRMLENMQNK